MGESVTYRSKKREIWNEKERLESLLRDKEQYARLLEEKLAAVEEEADLLRRKNEFTEQLKERLVTLNEKLDLITQVTKEISALNMERIFDVCITKIPYLLNARHASLYLYDVNKNRLILKKHSHKRNLDHVVDVEENEDSLMVQVLKQGKIRVIGDLGHFQEEESLRLNRRFADYYLTQSCIVAPLKAGETIYGVLNLADRQDGKAFSRDDDLPLIEQVAEMLAISLRNNHLFEEVQSQSRSDFLTRLMNHATFMEELQKEVERAARYKSDLSIILVDVDDFGVVNENYGYLAGDRILGELARIIRDSLRNVDLAARYAGDDFAILLPEQDKERARQIGNRIRERVNSLRFTFDDAMVEISLSMGIAQFQKGDTATALVQEANEALTEAQSQGDTIIVKA